MRMLSPFSPFFSTDQPFSPSSPRSPWRFSRTPCNTFPRPSRPTLSTPCSPSAVTVHPALVTVTKLAAFTAPAATVKPIEIIKKKILRICSSLCFALMPAPCRQVGLRMCCLQGPAFSTEKPRRRRPTLELPNVSYPRQAHGDDLERLDGETEAVRRGGEI